MIANHTLRGPGGGAAEVWFSIRGRNGSPAICSIVITGLDPVIHAEISPQDSLVDWTHVGKHCGTRSTAVQFNAAKRMNASAETTFLVIPAKAGIQQGHKNTAVFHLLGYTKLDPGLGAGTPNRDDN